MLLFFFSSRRRHTRLTCDWSSDVCSSDLLIPGEQVRTGEGELCSASFFAPDSKLDAPYARIATGDFPRLRRSWGRDCALAAYLHSLAHELVHYDQWLSSRAPTERGVVLKAKRTVERYAMDV